MFKIDKKTNKITITKGDNAELRVRVFDSEEQERQTFEDDTIVLTVRKHPTCPVLIQKEAVNGVIEFVPEDTKSLSPGIYHYDIQLTTFTGKIYTIVPMATFEVGEEITQ